MKNLTFFLFFLSGTIVFAGDETDRKGYPDFWVVSSVKGETPLDSCIFQFQVMNPELLPESVKKQALASCNGQSFPFSFDRSGKSALVVSPGTYRFQFFVAVIPSNYDSVAYTNYLEIYSDSVTIEKGMITSVRLHFRPADYEIIVDKPVLYLYSAKTIDFSVDVKPKGQFTFTYPPIEKGWKGSISPDGSLQLGARTYPYLFWEANCPAVASQVSSNEGFVVKGSETVRFLEEQLSSMGLNDREQTDFITYWAPRMSGNTNNFVHFLFNESCNSAAELSISPVPDVVYRVYMIWSEIPEGTKLNPMPQSIPQLNRNGFFAVEWGGSEINLNQLQTNISQL